MKGQCGEKTAPAKNGAGEKLALAKNRRRRKILPAKFAAKNMTGEICGDKRTQTKLLWNCHVGEKQILKWRNSG